MIHTERRPPNKDPKPREAIFDPTNSVCPTAKQLDLYKTAQTSCSRRVVLTRQIATRTHVTTKCQTLEFPQLIGTTHKTCRNNKPKNGTSESVETQALESTALRPPFSFIRNGPQSLQCNTLSAKATKCSRTFIPEEPSLTPQIKVAGPRTESA